MYDAANQIFHRPDLLPTAKYRTFFKNTFHCPVPNNSPNHIISYLRSICNVYLQQYGGNRTSGWQGRSVDAANFPFRGCPVIFTSIIPYRELLIYSRAYSIMWKPWTSKSINMVDSWYIKTCCELGGRQRIFLFKPIFGTVCNRWSL